MNLSNGELARKAQVMQDRADARRAEGAATAPGLLERLRRHKTAGALGATVVALTFFAPSFRATELDAAHKISDVAAAVMPGTDRAPEPPHEAIVSHSVQIDGHSAEADATLPVNGVDQARQLQMNNSEQSER